MSNASIEKTRLIDHGPHLVALTIFMVALWAQVGDAYVGRFLGDGLNLVLAKALARGDGLTLIHLPQDVPARWIYPLYPFVVSLVGRVWPSFPDNLVLIQILDSALLGCAAWIVALHLRKLDFPPLAAYVAIVLGFSNAAILSLAVSAFAEPLFLSVAAGAVFLADRQDVNPWTGLACGVLAGATALIGNLGVFVIVGVVAALGVRRQFVPAAVTALAALIVAAPWFVWSWRTVDPTGLAAVAVESARLQANMGGVVSWQGLGPLVNLLLSSLPSWAAIVLGPVAAGFFGVGLLSMFRSAPALVTVVSLCVLGAWIHPTGVPRNEWILFPWFLFLCVVGAWRSWGYARRTRIPVLLAAVVLGVIYVPRTVTSLATREFAASLQTQNEFLDLLFRSINAELPEDAVIASDAEAMVHLYTGRLVMPARLPATTGNTAETARVYCETGVTHIARTNLVVPASIDDTQIRNLGSSVSKVFALTHGPSLYRFTCPD